MYNLTGIFAEVFDDYEVTQLNLSKKVVPKKLIVMQEVKMEKKMLKRLSDSQILKKDLSLLTNNIIKDPSDLFKKLLFVVMALASIAAVRSIVLDLNVDTI